MTALNAGQENARGENAVKMRAVNDPNSTSPNLNIFQ